MPIGIACVKCRQPLRVPDEQAGQVVVCPHCQQAMPVPGPVAASGPPPLAVLAEMPHRCGYHRDEPKPSETERLLEDLRTRAGKCRPLPADLPEAARALGQPISYRAESSAVHREVVVIAAVCLLVGVVGLRLLERPTGLAAGVLAAVIVAGMVFYHVLLYKPAGYWFCPGGFVRARPGEAPIWVTWEDVQSVDVSDHVNGPHVTCRGEVNTREGKFELFGLEALEYVVRCAYEAQVPLFLLRLTRGQRVKLRPFVLEPAGLVCGQESYPWSALGEVFLSRKKLAVTLRNGDHWQRLPCEQVHLAAVLIAVCNEMIRLAGGGPLVPGDEAHDNPFAF
jgi:hypothetical protein